MDLDIAINEMQMKAFMGDMKLQEKLQHKIERKKELMHKREERIAEMGQMTEVSPKNLKLLDVPTWCRFRKWNTNNIST